MRVVIFIQEITIESRSKAETQFKFQKLGRKWQKVIQSFQFHDIQAQLRNFRRRPFESEWEIITRQRTHRHHL